MENRRYEKEEPRFHCEHCGWSGKAPDAKVIDFYGITSVHEVHCPRCDRIVGTMPSDEGKPL